MAVLLYQRPGRFAGRPDYRRMGPGARREGAPAELSAHPELLFHAGKPGLERPRPDLEPGYRGALLSGLTADLAVFDPAQVHYFAGDTGRSQDRGGHHSLLHGPALLPDLALSLRSDRLRVANAPAHGRPDL